MRETRKEMGAFQRVALNGFLENPPKQLHIQRAINKTDVLLDRQRADMRIAYEFEEMKASIGRQLIDILLNSPAIKLRAYAYSYNNPSPPFGMEIGIVIDPVSEETGSTSPPRKVKCWYCGRKHSEEICPSCGGPIE